MGRAGRSTGTPGPPSAGDLKIENYADGPAGLWEVYEAKPKLSVLTPGTQWVLVAPDGATYVLSYDSDSGKVKVSRSTINVIAAAASVAVGGGLVGVGVAGAGAVALNVVLSKTNAGIANSKVTTTNGDASHPGDVTVSAAATNAITATIAAVSLAVGGGLVGAGVAIGVAISRNYIGWQLDGSSAPSEVRATVRNSTISSPGHLRITATNGSQISALVFSASVAVGIGGFAGIAAAGSGVSADNRIKTVVQAAIDGDSAPGVVATGISAADILVSAGDTSTISAFAGAVAISLGAGLVGAALSIGVSLARNEIASVVEASISNASDVEATTGGDHRGSERPDRPSAPSRRRRAWRSRAGLVGRRR